MTEDNSPNVRLAFIWASENIATANPAAFQNRIEVFASLLDDCDSRVRIETPEIFRVIGKRLPEIVAPYINKLRQLAENDPERVVRIHALGAIKAMESQRK